MKNSLEQVLLRVLVASFFLSCGGLVSGCGDDSKGVNPGVKLCRNDHGFAARITGMAEPLDMCVSDEATIADYVPAGIGDARYEITAIFTSGDLTIEVLVNFFVQSTYPITLALTANRAQADSDHGAVWFYYHETKLGTYDYVPTSVTGIFTLTFNSPTLAVATFSGLEVQLEDGSSGDPVGVRNISEGYVSVTVE